MTPVKTKSLSARQKARLVKMRKDPLFRFGEALNDYLHTVGWTAVVIGSPQICGFGAGKSFGNFEFRVSFSGGRIKIAEKKVQK